MLSVWLFIVPHLPTIVVTHHWQCFPVPRKPPSGLAAHTALVLQYCSHCGDRTHGMCPPCAGPNAHGDYVAGQTGPTAERLLSHIPGTAEHKATHANLPGTTSIVKSLLVMHNKPPYGNKEQHVTLPRWFRYTTVQCATLQSVTTCV